MDRKRLIQKLFEKGKEAGITNMEVYIENGKQLSLKVFNKEIDSYSVSENEGLSFRGLYNEKMGYAYTEKVDETSIDLLINEAIENAQIIDSEDKEEIFEGSKEYKEVNNYNPDFENVSASDKITLTKRLEEEALKLDNRVKKVQYCMYGDGYGEIIIANTKGLELQDKGNLAYVYISVLAQEQDDFKTGSSYRASNNINDFNIEDIAREAVEEAISLLGAKSIPSGEYPVVLRNDASADLLEAFAGIFSAEAVQKNLSLLKDKINQKVASSRITIIDDPFMPNGMASKSFDGEGAACKYKEIIHKGVLKTYLYNLKTAQKDGVETTGNASKGSYKSSIDISPTNMYIQKGEESFNSLIGDIDKGLLIINLEGLHSGLNTVSGDFSLSASGFLIEQGKITRPVNQITIAGNYFELLKNIDTVANDLKFGLPEGAYIGSPSIKINKLAVEGE